MGTPVTTKLNNAYTIPDANERGWAGQVGPLLIELAQNSLMDGGSIDALTLTQILTMTPVSTSLAEGGTLSVSASNYYVQSTGGAVTLSATTPISNGSAQGQRLQIVGRSASDTVTIPDSGNVNLQGTWLGGLDDVLTLEWTGTNWIEISRSN